MLAAVPTARSRAIPLDDALNHFLAGLARADALKSSWRRPATETVWVHCAEAIGASRSEAERLQNSDVTLGFEALNARLGDVIAPLEEFADAAPMIRQFH